MSTVFCKKFNQELEALSRPPLPGKKGEELQATVSKKAWEQWLSLQTMLINEKHLSLFEPEAQQFLTEQREKFFNNQDYEKPSGYTPLD